MGLFEKIFGSRQSKKDVQKFFNTFTAYAPTFTTWNGALYESQLIRSAVHAKAKHISKLKVEVLGSAKPKLQTVLKNAPNDFQTWGQFLYRLSTILDMQTTAFIVPVENEIGETVGMYPVLPSMCSIKEYGRELYLQYNFASGKTAVVEYNRCGIMNKFQYKDDFFGSGNAALTPTMELINIQNQGIKEAIKSSATFRFMARMTNFSDPEDLKKEQKRFTKNNLSADSGGMLLFPNNYDNIQQIKSTPFVIDEGQMNAIKNNVFDYFGVNEDILQNKAYGDSWNAFYEGEIEYFSIQFSDVATKMNYTSREITEGSGIMATANRLQYMSNKDKLDFVTQLGDRGYISIDEGREVYNMSVLPDEQGKVRPIRGEYYLLNNDGSITQKGDKNEQKLK